MAKIHELLAAEQDRQEIANSLLNEGITTFTKRADHFTGFIKTVTMYAEDRQQENTEEHKQVVDTVQSKLDWVWGALTPAYDTFASKENSNTSPEARADVIVDGKTILSDIPNIVLLGLERKLGRLVELYQAIPTLDPGVLWAPDEAHELKNVFRTAHPQQQHKTEKKPEAFVLYEATDKHPAQVKESTLDKNVGKIELIKQSGMVSPAQKAEWLSRISKLHIAVKEARQRANSATVLPLNIGDSLYSYIHR